MKRFLLAVLTVLLLMPVYSEGNDLKSPVLRDSIVTADSTEGDGRYDTVYTAITSIEGATSLTFASAIYDIDTNFTADSMTVWIQHSFDRVNWTTVKLDTIKGRASLTDTIKPSTLTWGLDSLVWGTWLRGMFVYRDSAEADMDDRIGSVYTRGTSLWIGKRHGD